MPSMKPGIKSDLHIGVVDPSATTMELLVPGLSNSDFDRAATIAFHKLCRYFECGRVTSMNNPEFLSKNGRRVWKEAMMFVVITDYEVNQELYIRARQNYILQQYIVKTIYKGYSNSSLLLQTVLSDPKDNAVLGRINLKYVLVDPHTRKSVAVPEWFKQDFRMDSTIPSIDVSFSRPRLPDESKVFKFSYKMVPSDNDINGHVNNATYFRLCHDIGSVASVKHKWFSGIHGDLANYSCVKTTGLYSKECDTDDTVLIQVWEDDDLNKGTLHFLITKDNVISFSASMTFKPFPSRSKL